MSLTFAFVALVACRVESIVDLYVICVVSIVVLCRVTKTKILVCFAVGCIFELTLFVFMPRHNSIAVK